MLKRTKEDYVIETVIYLSLLFILFVTVYPFYYVLIISFNEGMDAARGGIYFFPRKLVFENYASFFSDSKWLNGLYISILSTVAGTFLGTFFTTMVAYGISYKDLVFRKFYMTVLIISMYFSGGIIPYYVLLREIHLLNTFWVYVVPGALSIFFVLIGVSFFSQISPSLRESAVIDGANEITVFLKIILPISTPFLATMILFIGVGHWNNWFDSAFFVRKKELRTLSYLTMEVINKSQLGANMSAADAGMRSSKITPLAIQSAAMMISILPVICVYPFLQKYFVKGLMIGSVKE
jgi:putative aldouronate transport system permease protein